MLLAALDARSLFGSTEASSRQTRWQMSAETQRRQDVSRVERTVMVERLKTDPVVFLFTIPGARELQEKKKEMGKIIEISNKVGRCRLNL